MKFEKEVFQHYQDSIKYINILLNSHFKILRQRVSADEVFNEGIINIQQHEAFSYSGLKKCFLSFLNESNKIYGTQITYDDQGNYKHSFEHYQSHYQCKRCLDVKHISLFASKSAMCLKCFVVYQKDRRDSLSASYIRHCIVALQKERSKRGISNNDNRAIVNIDPNKDQVSIFRDRIKEKRGRRGMSMKEKSKHWNRSCRENITDGYVRKLFHEASIKKLGTKITPNSLQIEKVRDFIKDKRANPKLFGKKSFIDLFPELKNV